MLHLNVCHSDYVDYGMQHALTDNRTTPFPFPGLVAAAVLASTAVLATVVVVAVG